MNIFWLMRQFPQNSCRLEQYSFTVRFSNSNKLLMDLDEILCQLRHGVEKEYNVDSSSLLP